MICGITIKYIIENWKTWRHLVNILFTNDVVTDTGEVGKTRGDKIVTTYNGTWETFYIVVREVYNKITCETIFHLTIKGSLHNNQFNGSNYLPFTYQLLQEQINHICKTLYINPTQAQISTLEVGINLVTPFEVKAFIEDNVIDYKGKLFNYYDVDSKGVCIGKHCKDHSQYEIKIYDKGKQNNLPQNLMRFEKSFHWMQPLQPIKEKQSLKELHPSNEIVIKYLSDLQDRPKVERLLKVLLDAWEDVFIYDIDLSKNEVEISRLKDKELITRGGDYAYWKRVKGKNSLVDRKFYKLRNKLKKYVPQFGNNLQQIVTELMQQEGKELFKKCTNLPIGEKAEKNNLTYMVKGKIVPRRFCLSCGKEITHQKEGSKYCSKKFNGEHLSHQCRNINSNPGNNFKNKLKKEEQKGLLFDIMPYFTNLPGYNNQSLK